MNINEQLQKAKEASYSAMSYSAEQKNKALQEIKKSMLKNKEKILDANKKDLENGKKKGLTNALLDRLELNDSRVNGMVTALDEVIGFNDPIGRVLEEKTLNNGLNLKKISVPIGVIGVIYEARPNVTLDTAALCLKSGNVVLLKGDETAFYSNIAIIETIKEGIQKAGLDEFTVQGIDPTKKEDVLTMLRANDSVDLIIPRGGLGLMKFMRENSQVPFIGAGAGVCHTYVDEFADLEKAVKIVVNAKTQRPSVCNALETLIVHEKISEKFLPLLEKELNAKNCEIRADAKAGKYLKKWKLADEKDWETEYLDYIISIKTVSSVEEAVKHIRQYGTRHSEAIVSESKKAIGYFFKNVDAAAVYSNASTRFTDGGEFGLGMEVGISTQKIHARGPMGVRELTTYKYIIEGNGQIRG
ncbi:MAG: glutamate-5-semialdehyde dehydrogenase [archaeon]